jgi:hypothetical protein
MAPASVLANHIQVPGTQSYGPGKITMLASMDSESAKELIRPDMSNPVLLDNPNLRLTVREGSATLAYLANPTGFAQKTMLISSRPLRGVWNAPEGAQSGTVTAECNPYSVQVWEVVQ